MRLGDKWFPLVVKERRLVSGIVHNANEIEKQTGKKYKLIHFIEEVEN